MNRIWRYEFMIFGLVALGCGQDRVAEVVPTSSSGTPATRATIESPVDSANLLCERVDEGRRVDPFADPQPKSTILIFLKTDCPIANRYAPTIQKLSERYQSQPVRMWLVFADKSESREAIQKHLAEFRYQTPAVRDPEHKLVAFCGATKTPEAVVFSSGRKRVYRGRIDDLFTDFGKRRDQPTSHDLRNAIDAVLAGTAVDPNERPAIGCDIVAIGSHRPPAEAFPTAAYAKHPVGTLSFTADIAPTIFTKCASCHRPGEIGPFPLLSYADVRKRAAQIVAVTQNRTMPPWSAVPGYCRFEADGSLTVQELGRIAQWVDEGAPQGDPARLPPFPEFREGWKHGTPDLVVTMSESFTLDADVTDANRNFAIRVPITESKYVMGWEFDPGNTKVVHHAFLKVDRSGWSRHLDEMDPLPGFDGVMLEGGRSPVGFNLGWLPGCPPPPPDERLSWLLEPGTDLVLEMHLCGTGKRETVQSSIALYFAKQPPTAHPGIAGLIAREIDIPAGERAYVVHDEYVLPVAATVTGIGAHAHYRGKDVKVWAEEPDGSKSWLLRITDWDFNWQNRYTYAQPFKFPRGTTLYMQLTYDNSAENPRNPTVPPERVLLGRRSRDEMGEIAIHLLLDNDRDARIFQQDSDIEGTKKRIEQLLFLCHRDPNNAEAHFILGSRYQSLSDLPRAAESYETSIRIDPNNSRSRNNLGSVYRKLGRTEDAIAQYTAAIRIAPNDAKAHNNLGSLWLAQGDLDRAVPLFQTALQINADFEEAEYNLGVVAMQRKEFVTAAKHFERALQLNPRYEPARAAMQHMHSR
jgi:Tfp pilus assembly protein PilF